MESKGAAQWDWGDGASTPPSASRVDARGWVVASLALGAVAGAAALAILWRSIPLLPMPPGTVGEHLGYWARLACHAASERLFARACADYAAFWAGLPEPERFGMICRCALAACAALAPAVLLSRPMLRPRDRLIEMRGSRRVSGKDAARELSHALRSRVKRGLDHEIAPGVAYPAELWARGTLIVGGVGSGKSTALRPLINKVVSSGEQLLLFDAKSELTSGWKGPAILAPWDSRSLVWDIAKDFRNALEMERFAATMIRESSDPMWSSASRQILVGLMLSLRGTRGTEWGWGELRDMVSLPQAELRDAMEKWHPLAARSLAKATVTSAGILINLASFCAPIFHLAEAWGSLPASRRVSIVDWTLGRSKHRQLVLQGHGSYGELARPLAEGIIGVFASLIASVEMRDDPKRKIWLIADECSQLGKLPMEVFSMGRSRGVRAVVATQDFAQLEEAYGEPAVQALVSMVGTIVVGQTMAGQSADLLCKAFGSREVERPAMSAQAASAGPAPPSFSRDEVPLYKPSELASRLGLSEDGRSVVLILCTGGVAYELSWPLFPMREARPAHMPAEWTRGARRRIPAEANPAPIGDESALPDNDASLSDGGAPPPFV